MVVSFSSHYGCVISSCNVVCIVQVKVRPKLARIKLIVVISLYIRVMASQGRICVQCVTNGLEVKHI